MRLKTLLILFEISTIPAFILLFSLFINTNNSIIQSLSIIAVGLYILTFMVSTHVIDLIGYGDIKNYKIF